MGSTSEDYLDNLLRAAMEPVKKEETKPVDESAPIEENPMSADEIDAMLLNLENESVEVKDEPIYATPIEENPMSTDEIDAMLADLAMQEEMPVAEEEQPVVMPVDDNPNRQLTPEEIAAMFATTETVTEPVVEEVTEEVIEEMPVAEEEQPVVMPVDDNPNRQLTPEEIATMFAATEESVIEDVSEEDEEVGESLDEFLTAADTNEELEIDLDNVDDLDALLGLREVPVEHHWDEETGQMVEGNAEDAEEDNVGELDDLASLLAVAGTVNDTVSAGSEDLENQDLSELLNMLGDDDGDLAEINDLLQKSDNNEIVEDDDMLALLGGLGDMGTESDTSLLSESDIESGLNEQEEKPKKKLWGKKKKEKVKKDAKATKEVDTVEETVTGELTPKEKGFFGKLFAALTEEVEEDEAEALGILEDGLPVAPKEKGKKKKDKKSKKNDKKTGASNDEILDELDEEDAIKDKGKKKKDKKAKKPKKEKKAKIPDIEEPSKKLPKKMIIRIFVLCFSLLAVLILVTVLLPQLLHFNDTRKAFYSGNYEEAYQGLIGQDLSDSDKILLEKAEILVQIERKLDVYDTYMAMDNKEKALNALFEGVAYYWEKEACFDELGIRDEANQAYVDILVVLQNDYLVEEEKAREIAAMDSIAYTYTIRELASDMYVPKEDSRENVQEEEAEPLEDLLEGEQ